MATTDVQPTVKRRNASLSRGSARYLRTHRALLWRITRNEVAARHAGSFLGSFWVFVAPLLILTVYALTYVVIFGTTIAGLTKYDYTLFIFAGLAPYLMTAESIGTGVGSVIANKSVLNNTVFPIDLAPVKAVLGSQGTMVVGMAATIVGGIFVHTLHWTIVLLPFVWLLNILWLIGVIWILSLLNVVFRDLQNMIAAILMVMLIISPFAYTVDSVPAALKPLIVFNPFAYFVVAYQQVVILGIVPSVGHTIVLIVLSVGTFALGSWFFGNAKRVIIDYV